MQIPARSPALSEASFGASDEDGWLTVPNTHALDYAEPFPPAYSPAVQAPLTPPPVTPIPAISHQIPLQTPPLLCTDCACLATPPSFEQLPAAAEPLVPAAHAAADDKVADTSAEPLQEQENAHRQAAASYNRPRTRSRAYPSTGVSAGDACIALLFACTAVLLAVLLLDPDSALQAWSAPRSTPFHPDNSNQPLLAHGVARAASPTQTAVPLQRAGSAGCSARVHAAAAQVLADSVGSGAGVAAVLRSVQALSASLAAAEDRFTAAMDFRVDPMLLNSAQDVCNLLSGTAGA